MENRPKSQHLFLGGSLHGQFLPLRSPGAPFFYERPLGTPLKSRAIGLRPCLELREIEGLTGRTWHIMLHDEVQREMQDDHKRRQLSRQAYFPQEFIFKRSTRQLLYVLDGYQPPTFEILTLMREYRPELVDEDY